MSTLHTTRLRTSLAVLVALGSLVASGAAWGSLAPDRLQAIRDLLAVHSSETPVPGFSVVVVSGGEIVFEQGYGVEVLGRSPKVTSRSPIGIGSQTKSFTAFAIMQLVEQGRVELDAPVVRYLPWFSTADGRGDEITVRMLLHNTSGIPSQDRWLTSSDRSEEAARRTVRQLSSVALVRPPGSSFEYSNENWTILGEIIAEVTGQRYSEYMQEHVYDALGMRNTTTALGLFEEKAVLYGHYTGLDEARPAKPRFLAEALAAGSEMRSSAHDMGRYLLVLLGGGELDGRRFLEPESVDLLFEPGIRTKLFMPEMGVQGEVAGYAMGWIEAEVDGRTIHHHGGDAIVMTSWTMLDREAGVGSSVLYNGPSLDSYRFHGKVWLAHNLLRLARGEPLSDFGQPKETDPLANDYELPPELLERYAGEYISERGLRARVAVEEDELVARVRTLDLDYVYAVDFVNEQAVVLRNLSSGTQARFLMTPSKSVTGIDGGIFGGPYRRLDPGRAQSTQAAEAAGVSLRLPASWTWTAGEEGLEATSADGATRLAAGFQQDQWETRRAALGDTSPERTETIGPWVWQQVIGVPSEGRRALVTSTPVGQRRFEIVLEAPAGELTHRVRDVLLPLFDSLQLELPSL